MVGCRFSTLSSTYRLSSDEMVLNHMVTVGAASVACEQKCAPRYWGGLWRIGSSEKFDECAPERPFFFEMMMSLRAPSRFGAVCSTAGRALIAALTALCSLGRRTNAFLASWSYLLLHARNRHMSVFTPSTHRRFGWRFPSTLRGRRCRRYPARRSSTACGQPGSQLWLPGTHWTLRTWLA